MKYWFAFFFLLTAFAAQAQKLTGLLLGDDGKQPLAHATIRAGAQVTQTNTSGIFSIDVSGTSDSVKITCAGYAPYAFKPATKRGKDTIVIYLALAVYNLKQVNIKANRDFKADSIRLRNDFNRVFNYKGTTLRDAFVNVDINKKVHEDYITTRNNTTQLVTVNVLQVISLLSKNKDRTSKLKQTLLKEETQSHIDQRFSKNKIETVTGLKGDSLRLFMQRYRPPAALIDQMTDYDLIAYIKKVCAEYRSARK